VAEEDLSEEMTLEKRREMRGRCVPSREHQGPRLGGQEGLHVFMEEQKGSVVGAQWARGERKEASQARALQDTDRNLACVI
jgi:hypothetical protein